MRSDHERTCERMHTTTFGTQYLLQNLKSMRQEVETSSIVRTSMIGELVLSYGQSAARITGRMPQSALMRCHPANISNSQIELTEQEKAYLLDGFDRVI